MLYSAATFRDKDVPASAHPSSAVRFGDFFLDLRTGELHKNGTRIRLAGQPFQVLTLLLREPGQMVTREELRSELWSEDTFVDFDDGLNTAIRNLRQALGDSAEHPTYIETLPRRGYRSIAPVESDLPAQPPSSAHERATTPPTAPEVSVDLPHPFATTTRRPIASIGVLAAGAILISTLSVGLWWWRLRPLAKPPVINSVAVLPLANLSGDPNQEYFSDGITEQLITNLGKVGGLRIISRTSVMRYKGSRKTLPEIARELNVDAIVEGAVLRSPQRVRITAQLVRGSPEEHLWAETYERDSTELLAVQNDLAAAITAKILGKLSPLQQAHLPSPQAINPEAHSAYMRARFFLQNRRSPEGARKALDYSLQATQLDPNSAPAFSALADSYVATSDLGAATAAEVMPAARAAAQRALALDPDLGNAHTSLADILLDYFLDWHGPEHEFKRALELNPSDAAAHVRYAGYLAAVGELDQAVAEAKRARDLDPLSLYSNREV